MGKKKVGMAIIRIMMGMPTSVGVMKEANRFSFILVLKGWGIFLRPRILWRG